MGFFENIFGDSFEIAYKEGVEQTSTVNNIYIDPDDFEDALASVGIDYGRLSFINEYNLPNIYENLELFSPDEASNLRQKMGAVLEASLEQQQTGLTQALLDKAESVTGEKADIGRIAMIVMTTGPLAIDNIPLNGEIYGIAALPSESLDSKDEVLEFLLHDSDLDNDTTNKVKDNMPGSSSDWAKIIGFHEGQHLDAKDTGDGSVNKLSEESKADRRVITEIRSSISKSKNVFFDEGIPDGIDPDMLLALKDLRALDSSKNEASGHATGPLLDSGDQASTLHIEVAKTYKQTMYDEVNENFDFESYEGKAYDAQSLLKENPEIFFNLVNNSLEELREISIDEYNKDPSSFKTRGSVVGAQILTDYINDFEDAYNRRVLDQDIPEKIHSAQFLPQEVESEFYADLKHENVLRSIEQEDREITTYKSDAAFNDFDWEDYKGKATDIDALYLENEGLYYTTIKDHIEALKQTSIDEYTKDPSQKNLVRMIEVEHIIDNTAPNLNHYLEQALGDDAPQLSTEGFVPEDKKREYYESRLAIKEVEKAIKAATEVREKAKAEIENTQKNNSEEDKPSNDINDDLSTKPEDNEYKQGVGGTAYTAQISLKESGEPNVDFEKGVTVAGLPVGDFFAKNAAPASENIKLVNATAPDAVAISQTQENTVATQSLG